MKQFIAITILSILVNALCLWDFIYTKKVFKHMKAESSAIYTSLLNEEVSTPEIANKILKLKDYWTDKMDILVVSISRKDLQPISDQLQFLDASITNNDQDSAVTYALLLKYNIEGLYEISGVHPLNVL